MKKWLNAITHRIADNQNGIRSMEWKDDGLLTIGDVSFIVDFGSRMRSEESRDRTFVLGKSRHMIEDYLALLRGQPTERIVDLGIFKGGSAVLYEKLFNPKKLVAIDWGQPVGALDAYIRDKGLDEIIRPYYGVDQADSAALTRIVAEEMAGQPIELVIDDASHFLHETRASFNILFPYLAAGGTYIVEDWGWAHWSAPVWQENGGQWADKEPLSNLIFELAMLSASRPDLVSSVTVKPSYVIVRKGHGTCEPGSFDISASYLNRGKPVTLLS